MDSSTVASLIADLGILSDAEKEELQNVLRQTGLTDDFWQRLEKLAVDVATKRSQAYDKINSDYDAVEDQVGATGAQQLAALKTDLETKLAALPAGNLGARAKLLQEYNHQLAAVIKKQDQQLEEASSIAIGTALQDLN